MSLTPRIDTIQRNHIINGDMSIVQRYPSNPGYNLSVNRLYYADRFSTYLNGPTTKVLSISTDTSSLPSFAACGYPVQQNLTLSVNTAFTPSDPGDECQSITYLMEGYDYQRLHGKKVTLSFWFKATVTGTYSCALSPGDAVTWLTTFQVPVANVWQFVQITAQMPTSTAGMLFTNSAGMQIVIAGIGGTNHQSSTLNQLVNGFFYMATGSTIWTNTPGATIQATLVSLVEGDAPDQHSFHLRGGSVTEELQLCKRYYEKSFPLGITPQGYGGAYELIMLQFITSTSTSYSNVRPYQVQKRTGATVHFYNISNNTIDTVDGSDAAGTGFAAYSATAFLSNEVGFSFLTASANFVYAYLNWTADAEL